MTVHQQVMDFIGLFAPPEQPEWGDITRTAFMNGQCLRFAQILSAAFSAHSPKIIGFGSIPQGTVFEDIVKDLKGNHYNHFVAAINGICYDADGVYANDVSELDVGIWVSHIQLRDIRRGRGFLPPVEWPDFFDDPHIVARDVYFGRVLSDLDLETYDYFPYRSDKFVERIQNALVERAKRTKK